MLLKNKTSIFHYYKKESDSFDLFFRSFQEKNLLKGNNILVLRRKE